MKQHESHKLILQLAASAFMASFLLNVAGMFFPPNMDVDPPVYQKPALFLQLLSYAAVIFGSTIMGVKLAEDKVTIPSAGFTMLSIATALGIVIFFELRSFSHEEYEKVYDIYSGYVMLLIPASIMLLYYRDVAVWVRALLGVYTIDQAVVMALYYCGYNKFTRLDQFSFIGYAMLQFYFLLLGINLWRQSRKLKNA